MRSLIRRLGGIPAMAAPMLLAAAIPGGCASGSREFPDRPRDQVWAAMVAVAERPDYPDWRVLDNEVAVEAEFDRILIYRTLRRDLHRPGAPPQRQDRSMRIEVSLLDTEPPAAVFRSTVAALPSRVSAEADRYFDSVAELLGEPPALPPLRRAAPPPAVPVRE